MNEKEIVEYKISLVNLDGTPKILKDKLCYFKIERIHPKEGLSVMTMYPNQEGKVGFKSYEGKDK